MHLRTQDHDEFLAVNKGFGLRTHRVSDGQLGLVEFLSEKLNQNLFVVHRLDKETSGLILFAKNKTAAQKIAELFEKQRVEKTYLFLTDQAHPQTHFSVDGHIDKEHNQFILKPDLETNSKTNFEFVKSVGKYFLWKAYPKTGKPHQIRLHAQKAAIPVLGDREHGGRDFFRLALHAQKVSFTLEEKQYAIEVETPQIFGESAQHDYAHLFEACYEKRQQIYEIPPQQPYRLVHTESEKLRADILNDRLWIYDYTSQGLTDVDKDAVYQFANAHQFKPIIRHMLDRGSGVGGLEKQTLESDDTFAENWIVQEEGVSYVMKTNAGFSPGLFLDQRENRRWVGAQADGKKVLNLFSYTSGFSVVAALGQATQVTTVDVSAKFLNWSKENFVANGLDPRAYEFFAQDCPLFLKGALKRGRRWDLIICDPPTFGRSKDAVWKIERDLPDLAAATFGCLENNGQILFTCNYEKMNRDDILKLFTAKLRGAFKIERPPQMSLDYEQTDDLKNLMKGFVLTKH